MHYTEAKSVCVEGKTFDLKTFQSSDISTCAEASGLVSTLTALIFEIDEFISESSSNQSAGAKQWRRHLMATRENLRSKRTMATMRNHELIARIKADNGRTKSDRFVTKLTSLVRDRISDDELKSLLHQANVDQT